MLVRTRPCLNEQHRITSPQVSGEIDCVRIPGSLTQDQLVKDIEQEAIQKAIENGAHADTVRIVHVEVTPLPYMTNGSVRVVVKAVGDSSSHIGIPLTSVAGWTAFVAERK